MTSLRVFVVDDEFPKIEEYIDQSVYDSRIDSQKLLHLVKVGDWEGQPYLKRVVGDILGSEQSVGGRIEIFGFTDPSICLSAIEDGLKPDVVIFDWEYGTGNIGWADSSASLQEILERTDAFVFIYSHVGQEIPPYLNKAEYDQYAERFQLFLKGEETSSIFSSEEFIVQYLVSRLSRSAVIKVHGIDVHFDPNGYLKSPSDILQLEDILGRAFLIEQLKALGSSLSDKTIEELLENSHRRIWYSKKGGYLIAPSAGMLMNKYKPEKDLSYAEAARKFGLSKLKEALEVGIARV